MPLDLKKVIPQIKNIETSTSYDLQRNRLEDTYNLFVEVSKKGEMLRAKLLETKESGKSSFFFPIPQLNKNIDEISECNYEFSLPHIVVATDGSQINPSAHEITSSFLLNIGLVAIPYFAGGIPVCLSSEPTLYSSSEDLNPKAFNESVPDEDLISYERTIKEIEEVVKLAKKYKEHNIPIIALLDGTLIHWHIEKFSNYFVELFIKRFSDALLELKALNIPVASFLSNSRSNDLINMLRIFKCPYDEVNCKKYCSSIESKKFPCNPGPDYVPVLDRKLIGQFFKEKKSSLGSRTILFKSTSKILNLYPDELKVYFFYINTGTETARVEIPEYVASDENLLDLIHNVVFLQCKVGFGYPVTLSEAHLQAVVNKNDRQIFYDLIKEQMLQDKRSIVRLSSKELRKRISFS